MAWSLLLSAIGLVFVFEGMTIFASPTFWRRMMQQMFIQKDSSLRIIGFISMLVGLTLVCIARDFY